MVPDRRQVITCANVDRNLWRYMASQGHKELHYRTKSASSVNPNPLRFGAWINGWANNRGAGDLGRHRAHYNVPLCVFLSYSQMALLHNISSSVIKNCFIRLNFAKVSSSRLNHSENHLVSSTNINVAHAFYSGNYHGFILDSNILVIRNMQQGCQVSQFILCQTCL